MAEQKTARQAGVGGERGSCTEHEGFLLGMAPGKDVRWGGWQKVTGSTVWEMDAAQLEESRPGQGKGGSGQYWLRGSIRTLGKDNTTGAVWTGVCLLPGHRECP